MKIAVTGSAGLIGQPLCEALRGLGYEVAEVDLVSYRNILEPTDLVEPFHWADAVIHLAAHIVTTSTFYAAPEDVLEVGVKGTINVIDMAREMDVKDLIVASSAEVYGEPLTLPTPETEPLKLADPLNPRFSYAASKIATEMLALHAGGFRKIQVFRPHNVYGARSKSGHVIPDMIAQARDSGVVAVKGTGAETRSFCHVSDVVQGIVTMYEKGESGIYHIGNDRETSMIKLATLISGKPPLCLPSQLAEGSPRRRCPDLTKMRALGYEPKVSLEDGIAAIMEGS